MKIDYQCPLCREVNEEPFNCSCGQFKLHADKIPQTEVNILARIVLSGAKKFYEDPKNQAAFEEWQKRRYSEITNA